MRSNALLSVIWLPPVICLQHSRYPVWWSLRCIGCHQIVAGRFFVILSISLSASFGPWSVALVLYGVGLPFDMSISAFLTTYCMAFDWDACMSPFGNFLSSIRGVAQVFRAV